MKTILLTGSSGGIGSAIHHTLKNAGYTVITADRSTYDLTSPAAIQELSSAITQIDTIVCAHGYIDTARAVAEQSTEAIHETFAVNVLSIAYLARQFPEVDMIVLSSTAALYPNGKYPVYSASKAAVNALMQNLARERPNHSYITICPGATNTKMREKIEHDAAQHQNPMVIADTVLGVMQEKNAYRSGDIVSVKKGATEIVSRID